MRQLDHGVDADPHRELHRDRVSRPGKCIADRHRPQELPVRVFWAIDGPVSEWNRQRGIGDRSVGRDAVRDRGGVHHRFECGSGLPDRVERPVEGRIAVVSASDQRPHVTRDGIECDDQALQVVGRASAVRRERRMAVPGMRLD